METCLNCGSGVVEYVALEHGADFRPDVHGFVPETGDVIAECGVCREFEIVAEYAWPAERESATARDDDEWPGESATARDDENADPGDVVDDEGRGHAW